MEKEILENIVNNVKQEISSVSDTSGLCYYTTNNICYDLENEKIQCKMCDTSQLCNINYKHYFALVALSNKEKYLIDITYNQFLKKENQTLRFFQTWPSEVLSQTKQGTELLTHLLEQGYDVVSDETMSLYLKSFNPKFQMNFSLDDIISTKTR